MKRARLTYFALVAGTIAIGLNVYRTDGVLPLSARDMIGDALWAFMVFWWMGALVPQAHTRTRGLAALAICIVVETSQLWHPPVLDAIRRTTVGQLVLGSGFESRDFLAYAAGVLGAVGIERAMRARFSRA